LALVLVCTVLLFANQLSFVYALKFTTATTVALLFGTLPIFTLLSETITTVQVVGGLAIGGGIVLAPRRGPAPEPPAE